GAKTCGEGAGPHPATDAALALRAILCETVDARLFNVVLTPNYNRPHKNHFHLEVTAGVSWFLVH
ncbi:MAG TPA: extensin family protein, partial [Kofleriaceae bacterium]